MAGRAAVVAGGAWAIRRLVPLLAALVAGGTWALWRLVPLLAALVADDATLRTAISTHARNVASLWYGACGGFWCTVAAVRRSCLRHCRGWQVSCRRAVSKVAVHLLFVGSQLGYRRCRLRRQAGHSNIRARALLLKSRQLGASTML